MLMQIMVDGLLTAYDRRGSGRVVVILHGWGDRAAGLQGLQKELAKGFDVIALDLPGFGGTQAPFKTWGLDDYAQFVSHFLDKLDAQAYALVGHSNGGAVAIKAIARGYMRPDRLVLLASAGIRGERAGRNRTLGYVAKVGKVLAMPLPKRAQRALRRRLYASVGSDLLVAEHLEDTFKRVVAEDVRSDAAEVAVPTLLMYGENDEATPVRYGQLLREQIKDSKLEVVPEAGHFVHLDAPSVVAEKVKEFLQ